MPQITITQFDYDRLTRLLDKKLPKDAYDEALQAELGNADVVEPSDIPHDAITLNSRVRFRDAEGKDREYWLVFPEDADVMSGKISILSPVGCALLGYRVGDTVSVPTPQGTNELTVEEVISQPEREGRFDV
ncbi:nucleoside diphosphate kinase regulator [Candidatus Saccharibacteria bacterium]|nr:nucleoside diphosphate kinase regulator [Candidatus Saccharibacteria bacterium]